MSDQKKRDDETLKSMAGAGFGDVKSADRMTDYNPVRSGDLPAKSAAEWNGRRNDVRGDEPTDYYRHNVKDQFDVDREPTLDSLRYTQVDPRGDSMWRRASIAAKSLKAKK